MAMVTQEFTSAPMGRRVVFQMVFGIGAVCVGFTVGIIAAFQAELKQPHQNPYNWIFVLLGPVVALAAGVPAFLCERSRVARFRIEENVLVLGKQSYPLEGAVAVERDPDVLKGARRTFGSGLAGLRILGFGKSNISGKFVSIQGMFRSKRLGRFYAFLTGTEKAVIVRWPDKAVAVSPSDPEFFIYMVRSGAGLR